MAKSPAKVDSLDEQIASLLESIELERQRTDPPERPGPPAPSRRNPSRPDEPPPQIMRTKQPRSAPPLVRKQAKEALPPRKSPQVAKEAALRRKSAPTPQVVKAERRPPTKARAVAPARTRGRPGVPRAFLADPAMELVLIVIIGLIFGALIGLLIARQIALSG